MGRRRIAIALVMCIPGVSLLPAPAADSSPSVGEAAPPVRAKEWLNTSGPVAWESLQGQLILVERWATWCPPCRATIPHLIKLHETFGKKGLAIVSCTDEKVEKVKPFVAEMKMTYPIALDGFDGYQTKFIPHAWLVLGGKVIWEGNPFNELQDSLIEENLKKLKPAKPAAPELKLPKELAAAQKDLDAGKYGAALKEIDRHLKAKSADVATAAKDASEKVRKYGDDLYAEAVALKKEKDFGEAVKVLAGIEKSFAGAPVADKAKAKKAEWLKDKDVKLEVAATAELDKARGLVEKKKAKEAESALKALADSKKYKGTKASERAKEELEKVKAST